jgi:hypothetical protein
MAVRFDKNTVRKHWNYFWETKTADKNDWLWVIGLTKHTGWGYDSTSTNIFKLLIAPLKALVITVIIIEVCLGYIVSLPFAVLAAIKIGGKSD